VVNTEIRIILVFLVAFFSSLYVIPKLVRIAKVIGLVDQPTEKRKFHKFPRPLVGGIGIVISATFSSLILVPISGLRGYFLGLSVLLLVGFLDDFKELGHRQKFIAQIVACFLLLYFSNVYLRSFGNLLGLGSIDVPDISWVVWGITIFCVVGVINAINLMDGLDGLAGGISFIAFVTFAIHASMGGEEALMLVNLALAGAVLGFLRFNWYPSSLFMGDAGSLCLGFSLAFIALALTQSSQPHVRPVCALLVLAVPITDTLTVMSKRILRGQSPFKPDQYHLHHIFMRYGMGRLQAVKIILGISVILSGISILGPIYNLPDYCLFAVYLLFFSAYIVSSFFIIYTMRLSLKFKKKNEQRKGHLQWISNAAMGKLDFFQIFRRSPRFEVDLTLVCKERERNFDFQGKVLNISSDGFMASIPQLDCLLDRVVAKITFPLETESHLIELPAEHLWFTEHGSTYYHGFRFLDFDGDQEQVVFKFLVRFKKNSN
jgi:UDP-GlcNAc:undecaprenyl-phosphate/decaprenyl-phosphate GlcNAc-1-phosphate transferase